MQGLNHIIKIFRNSLFIFISVSVFAIVINFIHPHRIPLVAEKPYEIYVPCPDSIGDIKEIGLDEFLSLSDKGIVIDARNREDFEKWHFNGAMNIEYDYLSAVCPMKIKEIISKKKTYVLIYGDGDEPDSGKELAKELATKGLKNVHFLRGGVKELNK